MKKVTKLVSIGVASLLMVGCSGKSGLVEDNSYNRTKAGAVAGAIAGAIGGYHHNTDGKSSRGKKAAIGAVLGAVAGGAVGYSLDEQANDVARALGTGVANDPLAQLDPNRNIVVSKTDTHVKIMFRDRMMFATNSSTLQPSARSKVNTLSTVLHKYPQTVVGVAGHTDSTGGYNYNLKLSKARASSVASLLGVASRTKGCAYNKPLTSNNTAANKALNRRVEVYLFGDSSYVVDPCI